MTPERWEQISEIYHSALELDSSEQKNFLEKACAGDESLRREIETLLLANSQAGNFIAQPLLKNISTLLKVKDFASLIGQTLGHYQILSQIGEGGMGEVYLAKDLRLNRQVALKTLPVSFVNQPNYLRRFETEVKAAATLNHSNVATIYSVEESDGQPFFTMEYVEGKTLDAFISNVELDLETFLGWFIPIADALSHAHEKGVIHRDIKPRNIMINHQGIPKILDFGLAQIDQTKTGEDSATLKLTHSGQVLGTPSYMSPEQAEGKQVDYSSDIFSLGVVMYEAFTGRRPFQGDSYASIVSELLTKNPPPVAEIKPDAPFLLSRLIMRCLEKDKSDRFGSMREIRAILQEIQSAVKAGIAPDNSLIPHFSQSKAASQRWSMLAVVLLIITFAGIAMYRYRQINPLPPLNFANVSLRKLSQTSNVVYAHVMPDGQSVAYNTIEENDNRAMWIRRTGDKNALQLLPPQPVSFWGGLTPSPDGSQIYYITADRISRRGTLYRISSLGGTPRKLVENVNDLGSVSTDGERLLFVRYLEKMQIISVNAVDGSDERVIYTGEANHIFRDPQFSLDGKSIFFIKLDRKDGNEFWSVIEISASGDGAEHIIIPPRKPRISEIIVLKDGSGLLINAFEAVSNLAQLFHVSLESGREIRITNDLNEYFGVSISHDGKTIVTSQRLFSNDIWVVSDNDPDSFRKLTTESNVYTTAGWTPDGRIVYDAMDNNRPHIWIMNGDGSNPQQLTPNDSFDFEPGVTPDGRYIVFTSDRSGARKIWRMDIDGRNPMLLTPESGATFGPSITPDGQKVLFSWDKENKRLLATVPLTGGKATEHPLFTTGFPSLSPDGKQLAYVFYDEQEKRYKTTVRPFDKEEEAQKIFNILPTYFLTWAADGKSLLYRSIESNSESNSTIWMQPIAGGEPKPLLSVKPDSVFKVSPSKDGKKMAVVRGKIISDAVMLARISKNE